VNTEVRCGRPIRLNSSSRKSTSTRTFEIAFSFMAGTSRPVKKACKPRVNQLVVNVIVQKPTIKHSAMYATAPRYASSLYASLIASESTTVVNQLTNSYKYMLGMSSRDWGVQSYSESSKKSSSFLVIMPVIRCRARESVVAKEFDVVN
jgi:hypothetical protein